MKHENEHRCGITVDCGSVRRLIELAVLFVVVERLDVEHIVQIARAVLGE